MHADTATNPAPRKLFAEVTSRCNLRCVACVKQSANADIPERDMTPETFARLLPAMSGLESVILTGVGEPLLNPHLTDFVALSARHAPTDCSIGFQTNARLLTRERAESLLGAGLTTVCLSMDAAAPEDFRRLRPGGEVSDVERGLTLLSELRNRTRARLSVGVEIVVMRDTAEHLSSVVRRAGDLGADYAIVTHVLPYSPQSAELAAFAPDTDKAHRFFDSWRKRAVAEGLDLKEYFSSAWKFEKSDNEKRLAAFMNSIRSEAREKGIPVNLGRIVQADRAAMKRLEDAFVAATAAARETGLELRLPALMPRSKRRCDFMEEGAAFVTADGNVHACAFLWHAFSCYPEGREKRVIPRPLGNVHEDDLLKIWNSTPFRELRQRVLAYDYPHCSSCPACPCTDVKTANFEQDCYGTLVPCGDCPWNSGLVQCLR